MSIYKDRLLLLAAFLDQLPNDRFYYNRWVGESWEGKPDLSCGTTACALGWATTIPQLQEAGLRLTRDVCKIGVVCLPERIEEVNSKHSSFDPSKEAANKVFDVNRSEFNYLFIPSYKMRSDSDEWDEWDNSYPRAPGENATSIEVANHIRYFVSRKYPS